MLRAFRDMCSTIGNIKKVCYYVDMSALLSVTAPSDRPECRPAHAGPSPISLPDLGQRVAALWADEPRVGIETREALLRELHDLDVLVERLITRRNAGRPVAAHHVRACAERYLALRERWAGAPVAA